MINFLIMKRHSYSEPLLAERYADYSKFTVLELLGIREYHLGVVNTMKKLLFELETLDLSLCVRSNFLDWLDNLGDEGDSVVDYSNLSDGDLYKLLLMTVRVIIGHSRAELDCLESYKTDILASKN